MSHVRFLARGIKFDRSCGVCEATSELQCKPLIPEPLITNNDPLLIKEWLKLMARSKGAKSEIKEKAGLVQSLFNKKTLHW